jgi:type IV pilus assembly protein PilE
MAAVALPAYQDSVVKTWRNKAAGCLTTLAQGMERRFTAALSYVGPALPPNSCTAEDGMAGRYAFSFETAPVATQFTLRAVPQGTQAARDGLCGTLSIRETGVRAITGTGTVDRCW